MYVEVKELKCACGASSLTSPWKVAKGLPNGNICRACLSAKQREKRNTVEGRQYARNAVLAYRSTEKGLAVTRESCNNYHRARLATDPLFLTKKRVRSTIKSALKKWGYKEQSITQQLLGCSFSEFLLYLNRPNGIPEGYELAHILPMALAYDEASAKLLSHYINFQLLTKEENAIKSDFIRLSCGTICRAQFLPKEQKQLLLKSYIKALL